MIKNASDGTHERWTSPDRGCRRPASPGLWHDPGTGCPCSTPWGAFCSVTHTVVIKPVFVIFIHWCRTFGFPLSPPHGRWARQPSERLWSQSTTGSPQPALTHTHTNEKHWASCEELISLRRGNTMEKAGSGHLLWGDPSSFSQSLLTVDVDWIEADEPVTHTPVREGGQQTSCRAVEFVDSNTKGHRFVWSSDPTIDPELFQTPPRLYILSELEPVGGSPWKPATQSQRDAGQWTDERKKNHLWWQQKDYFLNKSKSSSVWFSSTVVGVLSEDPCSITFDLTMPNHVSWAHHDQQFSGDQNGTEMLMIIHI